MNYENEEKDRYIAKGIRVPTDVSSRNSFSRKAAMNFGWDFATRLVNHGIKGVSVIYMDAVYILDAGVSNTDINNN
jgi:hypothetical protein